MKHFLKPISARGMAENRQMAGDFIFLLNILTLGPIDSADQDWDLTHMEN